MAGRKPRYKDPAEMQQAIDAYFKDCEGTPLLGEDGFPVLDKQGLPVLINARPPTVSGLALCLGFSSRQSLLHYQGRAGFEETVRRARLRVEDYCERRLYDKDGRQGAEFSLRFNFRWRDQDGEEPEGPSSGVVLMPDLPGTEGNEEK